MAGKTVPPPDHLPEHIKDLWVETQGQVYGSIGAIGLEALCAQVHRMREARQRIDSEGMVVQDTKGAPVPHPAIAIEKQAGAEVRTWLSKFGVGQ
jgi:P27 family predicted phage terminase small subunit